VTVDVRFKVEMKPAVAVKRVRPPVVETKDTVSPIMDDRRFGDEMKPAVAIKEVRPPTVETRLGDEMNPAVAT
jgi:hypothetical protein